jgi:hypothetical protein
MFATINCTEKRNNVAYPSALSDGLDLHAGKFQCSADPRRRTKKVGSGLLLQYIATHGDPIVATHYSLFTSHRFCTPTINVFCIT